MNKNRYNLLSDALIGVRLREGSRFKVQLPELLGLLARDEVADLPAVRAHQLPVIEEFLTRIAVLACERAGLDEPPTTADEWAKALHVLTPDGPDDEPWCLVVEDIARPAFLQPPQPTGAPPLKKTVRVPHDLDVLITARQHDVKAGVTQPDDPEAWLYALILLQSQSGFLGAGNFGVARMNGGFSNRSLIDLVPAVGRVGAAFNRNVRLLLRELPEMHRTGVLFGGRDATALLWLMPWDGSRSLSTDQLHILFVELARRVRLLAMPDGITAQAGSSKVIRVDAGATAGNLGDPWAALDVEEMPAKAMTLGGDGFGYRRVGRLLGAKVDGKRKFELPMLARPAKGDYEQAMTLRLRGLVRGQGKTEGFHARNVLITPRMRRWLMQATDNQSDESELAKRCESFTKQAADVVRRALRPALQNRPQTRPATDLFKLDDRFIQPWLDHFDKLVDRCFFHELRRTETETSAAALLAFTETLASLARQTFAEAMAALPKRDGHYPLTNASAEIRLDSGLRKLLTAAKDNVELERRAA